MHKSFTYKEIFKFGWQKTKQNFWFLFIIQIIVFGINMISDSSIIGFVLSLLTGLLITQIFLRISENEQLNFKNFLSNITVDKFLHYMLSTIITSIFVVVGFILLIVPGIIISIMTSFAPFILLEKDFKPSWKDLSFWQVIKKSKKMTYGYKWKIFVFMLIALGINLLGLIALGVGLFFTIPTTAIAFAKMYQIIKGEEAQEVKAEVV